MMISGKGIVLSSVVFCWALVMNVACASAPVSDHGAKPKASRSVVTSEETQSSPNYKPKQTTQDKGQAPAGTARKPAKAASLEMDRALPSLMKNEAPYRGFIRLDRVLSPPEQEPGRLLYLAMFAHYCEPCKKEVPFLIQMQKRYHKKGLRIAMVNIDRKEDEIESARRFIVEQSPPFPVLSDRFQLLCKLLMGEGTTSLPAAFLILPDGRIKAEFYGGGPEAEAAIETTIKTLLAAGRG